MQVETWEPSRRDKLRSEAFASTPYGKACRERRDEATHRSIEEQLQKGVKFCAEDMAEHEKWREKHYKQQPPRREV